MLQLHQELEEVSQTSGASNFQTFLRITLRLLTPAFLNGWLWVLVHAAKDFSVALLLVSAGSVVVANIIYESFVGGHAGRPHRFQSNLCCRGEEMDRPGDGALDVQSVQIV